jgi:ribosomal protein S18 acetylase RimI-like enzyme
VPTVGLNVGTANAGAQALYEELGFVPVVTYEEAELRRTRG